MNFMGEGLKYKHFIKNKTVEAITVVIIWKPDVENGFCFFVLHRSTITLITEEVKKPEV
jgi:hypothetical protein